MFDRVPEIMTFNECKSLLKIGKNTLLDLLHNGEIEAFRIGNRWKIPKKSVLDYIRYL
ncbi:helix-turn-helix domain-containing protein [Flavonifractor sp. An306]|uniref:helix-turn-helix domain-containing protein n=1 Tax=Flavonifractor sp. An306 TaxID=1965629 RepID=UPI000B4478C0|nr:excisionase [Flavonifractor sp. An306]